MKNSIERLKKQDYQTPELKVVAFKMEQGFAASAGIMGGRMGVGNFSDGGGL